MNEEINNEVTQEVVDPEQKKKKEKKPKSKARKIIEWVLLGIFIALFAFLGAAQIDGMIHKPQNNDEEIRFGVGTFVVLTNSMEPEYKTESAIITYKEDMEVLVNSLKGVKDSVVVSDTSEELVMTFTKNSSMDITFKNKSTGIVPATFDFKTPEYATGECVTTGLVMTHRIRELHVRKNMAYGSGKYIFVTSGINDHGDYSLQGQYQFVTENLYLGTVKLNSPFLGGVLRFMSSVWGLLILLLIPAAYLIIVSAKDIFRALKESDEEENQNKTPSSLDTISEEDRERLKRELLDEMIAKQGEKKKDEEDK